jgi:hypothetical protein
MQRSWSSKNPRRRCSGYARPRHVCGCGCVRFRLEPRGRRVGPREAETIDSAAPAEVRGPEAVARATGVRVATPTARARAIARFQREEAAGRGAAGPAGAVPRRPKVDLGSLTPVTQARVWTAPDRGLARIPPQWADAPPISGLVRAHVIVKEDRTPGRPRRSRPIGVKR